MGDVNRMGRAKSIGKKSCDQQLLPRIPDEITIAEICPKLTLPVLNNLVAVSCGWLRAFQSRQIYEARRVSKAEQPTFVVRANATGEALRLALYSVEDDSVFYLPQIPRFTPSTTIESLTFTSLDGKLYVMGSLTEENTAPSSACKGRFTYVYDLVGRIGWRKRSYPEYVNRPVDSAVINGKIFVCSEIDPNSEWHCAIYDPDKGAWSKAKFLVTVIHTSLAPLFAVIHEDLTGLDYGSEKFWFYKAKWLNCIHSSPWIENPKVVNMYSGFRSLICFSCDDPFHLPDVVMLERIKAGKAIVVLIADGKFLKITQHGLHVYNNYTNTWTPLHFESPSQLEHIDILRSGVSHRLNLEPSGLTATSISVAVLNNTVFSLVKALGDLFLTRREVEVGGKHPEVPVNRDSNVWKPIDMKSKAHRLLCREFLKCPVPL